MRYTTLAASGANLSIARGNSPHAAQLKPNTYNTQYEKDNYRTPRPGRRGYG